MSPLAAIGVAAVLILEGLFCWACCHVCAHADLRAELFDRARQEAAERPDAAMLIGGGKLASHKSELQHD